MKILPSLLLFSALCQAQDAAREIWDSGFLQKRPAGPRSSATKQAGAARYKTSDHSSDLSKAPQPALGVTVWCLRTPKSKDTDSRLFVYDSGGSGDTFIPERVDLSRPLHDGDRIRLGIEVPRSGYLYVVDRERNHDQSFGNPILLFPSLQFNHGDNRVEPGQLIELPPPGAAIRSLRLVRRDDRHIGEDLIFIVSSRPLTQIVPAEAEQALPAPLIAQWDHDWAKTSMRLDLQDAPSASWTLAEKEAGSGSSSRLTRADPLPAAIFTIPATQGDTFLIHVPLTIE